MRHPGFDYVLSGLFLAAALVFPVFFHGLGLGSTFLPMFYPLTLAGFLVAPSLAMIVGLSAPLLSALLTGMPPFYPPIAFIMVGEALLITSSLQPLQKWFHLPPWLALLIVLILDRGALFFMVKIIARFMTLPPSMLGWASVISGLPGLVMMMIVLPWFIPKLLVKKMQIVRRYEKE